MKTTASQIKTTANSKKMNVLTVIPSKFAEVEYLAVTIKPFVTAYFLMCNETFNYTYSHTVNNVNGKTYKRRPAGF